MIYLIVASFLSKIFNLESADSAAYWSFHLVAKGVTFALQPHISIGMLNRNLQDTASVKVCLCLYIYMCCLCMSMTTFLDANREWNKNFETFLMGNPIVMSCLESQKELELINEWAFIYNRFFRLILLFFPGPCWNLLWMITVIFSCSLSLMKRSISSILREGSFQPSWCPWRMKKGAYR